MEYPTKYPRTYHLPFSKGLCNDDRKVDNYWERYIINKPIIITEKLDGSNSCITKYGVYGRSHTTFTDNSWDNNLIEKNGLFDRVKGNFCDDMYIYGENMYAVHSIEYNKLPEYFFIFVYRLHDTFRSWDETVFVSTCLKIPTVPVLYTGTVKSANELKSIIDSLMNNKSQFGNTIEGVVVRNVCEFHYKDFHKYVVKYVRENHVQTNEHWRNNWKKAKLFHYNMKSDNLTKG